MSNVSKSINSYVNVYADSNPIWIAELNNGEMIYQDDGKPDCHPESAWLRLKEYCEQNDLSIKSISVKNRSIQKQIVSDADSFTFCKSAGALMFGGQTSHSFVFGYVNDGVYRAKKVNLPEMIIDRPEKRNIEDYRNLIIRRSGKVELQT